MTHLIGDFYEVREFHSTIQEIVHEGGPVAEEPLLKACVGAVIRNPFAGRYVEDLSPLTAPSAALGTELGRRAAAFRLVHRPPPESPALEPRQQHSPPAS